jgi:hypothetical protein
VGEAARTLADTLGGWGRAAGAPATAPDLDYERFLAGHVVVPYYLLKQINISLCQHLLTQLSRPHHRTVRAVLLLLIMEQCRSKIRLERCAPTHASTPCVGPLATACATRPGHTHIVAHPSTHHTYIHAHMPTYIRTFIHAYTHVRTPVCLSAQPVLTGGLAQ